MGVGDARTMAIVVTVDIVVTASVSTAVLAMIIVHNTRHVTTVFVISDVPPMDSVLVVSANQGLAFRDVITTANAPRERFAPIKSA